MCEPDGSRVVPIMASWGSVTVSGSVPDFAPVSSRKRLSFGLTIQSALNDVLMSFISRCSVRSRRAGNRVATAPTRAGLPARSPKIGEPDAARSPAPMRRRGRRWCSRPRSARTWRRAGRTTVRGPPRWSTPSVDQAHSARTSASASIGESAFEPFPNRARSGAAAASGWCRWRPDRTGGRVRSWRSASASLRCTRRRRRRAARRALRRSPRRRGRGGPARPGSAATRSIVASPWRRP